MFEGIKYAAKEQMSEAYAVFAAGVDPKSQEGQRYLAQLRETAEAASRTTIFSRPDVAAMMPGIAGMADVPLEQSMPFMKGAIQFGELTKQAGAAQGQHYEAAESASAAIMLSHLLGISDPDKMGPVLNALLPAVLTSHRSPGGLVKNFQYMLGSAAGVGMDQSEAINLGTLGATLMPGTRAGTNLNQMLTSMMPKGGPGAGTKISRGAAARQALLEKMHLIDPETHQLYRDAQGGMVRPMIEHLQDYLKEHPATAYGDFVALSGQRGARAAFELARNPKSVPMLSELERREANAGAMGGVRHPAGYERKPEQPGAPQLGEPQNDRYRHGRRHHPGPDQRFPGPECRPGGGARLS
jgi:hypothetical protein